MADTEDAYRAAVTRGRLDEFQQLFVYVWMLAAFAAGVGYAFGAAGRGLWRRLVLARRDRALWAAARAKHNRLT